jgi:hypothetical protein
MISKIKVAEALGFVGAALQWWANGVKDQQRHELEEHLELAAALIAGRPLAPNEKSLMEKHALEPTLRGIVRLRKELLDAKGEVAGLQAQLRPPKPPEERPYGAQRDA